MKILLFDLETSPLVGYVWGKYDQTVPEFVRDWHILSFSYKWLGKPVKAHALPDFRLYKKDRHNDRELVKKLWELIDEADVLVAHNGIDFDIKRANARFSFHGLKPPAPYKVVDTLKILRKNFSFTSNKLDDVSKQLGFGAKLKHEGIGLWIKCLDGDRKSWRKMVQYNKRDVVLLEKLYLYLLPWISNHPNQNLYSEGSVCPKCASPKLHARGYVRTLAGVFRKFQCQKCGGWSRGKQNVHKIDLLNV